MPAKYYIVEFHGPKGWEILSEYVSFSHALQVFTRELEARQYDVRLVTVGNGNDIEPESRRV
jgi:hypothetical protein